MKVQAILLLLAVMIGFIAPPSVPLCCDQGTAPAIGTLDVCHSAMPALSAQGGMPFISEFPYLTRPFLQVATVTAECDPFTPTLLVLQAEHPPQA